MTARERGKKGAMWRDFRASAAKRKERKRKKLGFFFSGVRKKKKRRICMRSEEGGGGVIRKLRDASGQDEWEKGALTHSREEVHLRPFR